MSPLFSIQSLTIARGSQIPPHVLVDNLNVEIYPGEIVALVGESGSGKSITALSILGLLPKALKVSNKSAIFYKNENIIDFSEHTFRKLRGKKIAMIFQDPQSAFNPVMTMGAQLLEAFAKPLNRKAKIQHIENLLEQVAIPNPKTCLQLYPHQLSGGMRQRVMIALALLNEPELIIADEPTTALDVISQRQILSLLKQLCLERRIGLLLITHDLSLVAPMAHRMYILYGGKLLESGTTQSLLEHPKHPYTQGLLRCLPQLTTQAQETRLHSMKGQIPHDSADSPLCRFLARCPYKQECCETESPPWHTEETHRWHCHFTTPPSSHLPAPIEKQKRFLQEQNIKQPVLSVKHLKVSSHPHKTIVENISFEVYPGEILALVGSSGCGKTTIARALLHLIPLSQGEVWLHQKPWSTLRGSALRKERRHMQIVFQDPVAALNPKQRIVDALEEALGPPYRGYSKLAKIEKIDHLLQQVGLDPESKWRFPHEFSGGQRQRICIARALAPFPSILICDEPTSALDVSVQAQILNLLLDLKEQGLGILLITHNLAIVAQCAERVALMENGKIIEMGDTKEILANPQHSYTKSILEILKR